MYDAQATAQRFVVGYHQPELATSEVGALELTQVDPVRGFDGGSSCAFGESQTSLGEACSAPKRAIAKQASHV